MNVILKLKASKNDTFNPLWKLLNDSNIPYRLIGYKFGNRADIEIAEEEVQEVIQILSTAPKYQLLQQTFA